MASELPFGLEQIAYGSLSSTAPLALTPPAALECLLETLNLGIEDVFVDLGCGSGGVLIAASRTGARVIGYELDDDLANEAEQSLAGQGLRIGDGPGEFRVIREDIATADLSNSTVVFMYLVPKQQRALLGHLEDYFRLPGRRRVATYEFPLESEAFGEPQTDPRYKFFIYDSIKT